MEMSEGVLVIIASSLGAGISGFFTSMTARTGERWNRKKMICKNCQIK